MITWRIDENDVQYLVELLRNPANSEQSGHYARLLATLDAAIHNPSDALMCYCDTNYLMGKFQFSYRINGADTIHCPVNADVVHSEYLGILGLLYELVHRKYENKEVVIFNDSQAIVMTLNGRGGHRDVTLQGYYYAVQEELSKLRHKGNTVSFRHMGRSKLNSILGLRHGNY